MGSYPSACQKERKTKQKSILSENTKQTLQKQESDELDVNFDDRGFSLQIPAIMTQTKCENQIFHSEISESDFPKLLQIPPPTRMSRNRFVRDGVQLIFIQNTKLTARSADTSIFLDQQTQNFEVIHRCYSTQQINPSQQNSQRSSEERKGILKCIRSQQSKNDTKGEKSMTKNVRFTQNTNFNSSMGRHTRYKLGNRVIILKSKRSFKMLQTMF